MTDKEFLEKVADIARFIRRRYDGDYDRVILPAAWLSLECRELQEEASKRLTELDGSSVG